MNRKNNCIACRYKEDGVKTRKALVHTCGKYFLPGFQREEVYSPDIEFEYIDLAHLWKEQNKNRVWEDTGEAEHCNAFTDLEGKHKTSKVKQFWPYITQIFKKKPHN